MGYDEHEMLVEYSEMTAFNFNSKEYQEVKKDFIECKNVTNNFLINFVSKFRNYKTMFVYVNDEVVKYNNSLSEYARRLLEERKKKADSLAFISKTLQIPLPINKNAPNIKPVQLKRVVRSVPKKPTTKTIVPEPYISDEDYNNINKIIIITKRMITSVWKSFSFFLILLRV